MKRESRILIINKANRGIYGIVIRGVLGFEDFMMFGTCQELRVFLAERRGIFGEIVYIVPLDRELSRCLDGLHIRILSSEELCKEAGKQMCEALHRSLILLKMVEARVEALWQQDQTMDRKAI